MDPRRKRAVVVATLPAAFTGAFIAVTSRVSGNHIYQIVLGVWLLFVLCCFVFAMRDLIALKRDGNPT